MREDIVKLVEIDCLQGTAKTSHEDLVDQVTGTRCATQSVHVLVQDCAGVGLVDIVIEVIKPQFR